MKEKYVILKTAKLAREKGLDTQLDIGGNCGCYNKEGELVSYHVHFNYPDREEYVFAPTQSLLARWLREVHGIQVYVNSQTKNGKGKYRDYVAHVNGREINDARDEEFQTYEEAMEVGLQVALEELENI